MSVLTQCAYTQLLLAKSMRVRKPLSRVARRELRVHVDIHASYLECRGETGRRERQD